MDGIGCHYCQSFIRFAGTHGVLCGRYHRYRLGMPDDAAYWLGGCMGNNLPAVGAMSSEKNSIVGTATILNRSIMVSNRTGGFASC